MSGQDEVKVFNTGSDRGGDNVALLAALLSGRQGSSDNTALLAALNNRRDDGFGGGGLGLVALLALLGGRRGGGLFGGGDGDGCGTAAALQVTTKSDTILDKIGDSSTATLVAIGAAKDSISTQANAIALAQANANAQNLLEVAKGFGSLQAAVNADGDRTRALITGFNTADLERQITVLASQLADCRNEHRSHRDSVSVTQTVTQAQAQAQQQQAVVDRIDELRRAVVRISRDQEITNQAINIGGLQNANPVNTNNRVNG